MDRCVCVRKQLNLVAAYSCMLGCQESRVVKSVQVILEYSWVSTSTGTKHLNFGIYEVDLGINLAACDSSYSGIQRRIKS